jgi:hypothetical protein
MPNEVAEMSEDMLDDLLGDIDIDAAIAASGKTSKRNAPTAPEANSCAAHTAPESNSSALTSTSGLLQFQTVAVPDKNCDATRGTIPHSDVTVSPCRVDDEMIANLMQGLDGDDFADV